jgi:outer membrane protein insertion porin family
MMFKMLLISLGLLLLANTVSYAAQNEDVVRQPTIEKIIINGAGDATDSVLQGMSLVVGDEFSPDLLNASEQWLWQHMRLRVLQIQELPGSSPGLMILELTVESFRSWKQVVFEGYDELTPPEIEVAIGLMGQAVDELEFNKYEQRILDFYFEQGFRGTEVSTVDRGDYLAFVISEGEQVTISGIRFEGNTFFNEGGVWAVFHWGDDLYELLQQKDGIFGDDLFSDYLVVEDINSLIMLYRDYGFLDVEVHCRLEESESAAKITLVYEITEGSRYTVRSVQFEKRQGGELMFADGQLHQSIDLRSGQFYSSARVKKSAFDIQSKYSEVGHPSMSRVRANGEKSDRYFWVGSSDGPGEPSLLFDLNEPVVDVVFTIQEGEAFNLRDIVLRGHLGSEDRILRRQVELEPGDDAREDLVNRSWRRLNGLNYFKDANQQPSVNWHWQQVDSRPDLIDLVFEVQDKGLMNNFRFGGAWNSETGPQLMLSLEKSNVDIFDGSDAFTDVFTDLQEGKAFHGAGQSLSIRAQPGTRYSTFAFSFTEPDLLLEHIDRLGFNIKVSKNIRYQITHQEQRSFTGFTLSRRFGRHFSVFGGPTLGNVNINDVIGSAPISVLDFEGTSGYRSIMFGARRNTVLDQFSPVDGSVQSVSVSQTGGFFGGDWDFTKSTLKLAKHFPLWEDAESHRWVLSLKGMAQKAWLQGDMTILPYSESFFQGGYRSLRGFAFRGTNRDINGFARPGSAAWSSSIELGFPMFSTRNRQTVSMLESLRGAAFIDFGAVGSDFGELTSTRVSAGIAFKIRMPFMQQLPISLIFATPLRSEDNDQTSSFQLQMGSSF